MQEKIFFVTCRNLISDTAGASDFGNGSPTHPEQLRVGEALVTLPDGYASGEPPPPTSITAYPEDLAAKPPILGSDKLFQQLLAILSNNTPTDILFYIHGYDTTFKEGLSYAAQLQHNINAVRADLTHTPPANSALQLPRVQVVIFSWPSEGRLTPWISYFDDRSEAELAQQPLARAIGKLKSKLDELHLERLASHAA